MSAAITRAEPIVIAGTVGVNGAFLLEIKEVNQELWLLLEKLRYRCSRPISMRSQSQELVDCLAELAHLVAMQFSLEEAYGYVENARAVDPHLSERAEAIRAEHRELDLTIKQIAELADDLLYERRLASLTTIVPVSFDSFYCALWRHERAERELTREALLKEIGDGN